MWAVPRKFGIMLIWETISGVHSSKMILRPFSTSRRKLIQLRTPQLLTVLHLAEVEDHVGAELAHHGLEVHLGVPLMGPL